LLFRAETYMVCVYVFRNEISVTSVRIEKFLYRSHCKRELPEDNEANGWQGS